MICNFHTHSTCCDGLDTPEDMIITAIEKSFSALGFSSHSYIALDEGYTIPKDPKNYKDLISDLREKYRDSISVYCGIEQDCFTEIPAEGYDYIIGSVHFVKSGDELLGIDYTKDMTLDIINRYFDGDFDEMAECYFNLESRVAEITKCDIIGHFDLISKYSEIYGIGESDRYLSAAEKAVKRIIKSCRIFEINTGAMASGYKSVPYPTINILKIIKDNGGSIMIGSDCHRKEQLDHGFKEAEELAKKAGFTEKIIYTDKGFVGIPI